MGYVKRAPEIRREHKGRYGRLSKADIVEAFRDIFREFGGAGELDDEQWIEDLEHRIENLKRYRNGSGGDAAR